MSEAEVIVQWNPLVWKLTNRAANLTHFSSCGMSLEDLYQEGVIGLLQAHRRFTPAKSSFITYATHYIWGYLRTAIRRNVGLIHIPEAYHSRKGLATTNGDRVLLLLNQRSLLTQYDKEMYATRSEDLELITELDILHNAMQRIDPRRAAILKMKYLERQPDREIGKHFGISRARIGQLVQDSLRRLRQEFLRLQAES